jgi:hypothetical protein
MLTAIRIFPTSVSADTTQLDKAIDTTYKIQTSLVKKIYELRRSCSWQPCTMIDVGNSYFTLQAAPQASKV